MKNLNDLKEVDLFKEIMAEYPAKRDKVRADLAIRYKSKYNEKHLKENKDK